MKRLILLFLLVSTELFAQLHLDNNSFKMYNGRLITIIPDTVVAPILVYQADSTIIRFEIVLPAHIVPANDSTWLGTLPSNFLVTEVHCWVKQSFNAIGDDILKIGHVDNKDAYMTEVDIGSTGIKTWNHVADGVRVGKYETVERGVWAWYTYTESIPTNGLAIVYIKGVQVGVEP